MNWEKVVADLLAQANAAVSSVEALKKRVPIQHIPGNDPSVDERVKTIERHRINANFCLAMARALEAGIE